MNKYHQGFYGGKFIPFHKGHKYCIDFASKICDRLTVILFYGGEEEEYIKKQNHNIELKYISVDYRIEAIDDFCKKFDNVRFLYFDCNVIYSALPNLDHWDAETPFVKSVIKDMDVVFSSEIQYSDYFKLAYPSAKHILIDPPRINVPISATKLRNMDINLASKWL